jgi:hypothetical protein
MVAIKSALVNCASASAQERAADTVFNLFGRELVRLAGLEPARLSPLPPQSSVSANSTISATVGTRQFAQEPSKTQASYVLFGLRKREDCQQNSKLVKKLLAFWRAMCQLHDVQGNGCLRDPGEKWNLMGKSRA